MNADLSIEVIRRIHSNAWCSFRKYTLELYNRPSALLEFKTRMLRAEVLEAILYGCVTWSPRRPKCVMFGELVGGQEKEWRWDVS